MTDIRFPRASNRADWRFWLKNTDPENGSLIDIPVNMITLQVRRHGQCGPSLSASPGDGKITSPQAGVLEVRFPASEVRGLSAGTYEVGAILSDGTDTVQLILGSVPIYDGVVR